MAQRPRRSTISPSNSMLVPYARRSLAVVPATSDLTLPHGWDVKEVPRSDGSRSDRYYFEPGSGRKFRSIKEINRYLKGEPSYSFGSKTKMIVPFKRQRNIGYRAMVVSGRKNHRYRRMLVSGGKLLRVDNEGSKNHLGVVRAAPCILPDGWIVEEIPRKYMSFTDKYYYEPETGVKFRSLIAVERYLAELDEDAPLSITFREILEKKPSSQALKLENLKCYTRRKKNVSREKPQASSFIEPPMQVTWVLASSQGDSWNPFISEALVPDAVKQQWTNRFMLFMKEGTTDFQSFQT